MVETKKCTRCEETKTLDEFSRRGSKRRSACKACTNREAKIKNENRPRFSGEHPTEKQCTKCEQIKPSSAFATNGLNKDGLQYWCRECTNQRNTEKRYGLSTEQIVKMKVAQQYKCAWCGVPEGDSGGKGLVIDHCWDTGVVRRLLCHQCNIFEGMMKKLWPEGLLLREQTAWFKWQD